MHKFTRKDFLEALFHEYFRKQEGFVLVKATRNLDRKSSTRYFPNVEILAKEQYPSDQNVFFGICPHENMKPDKAYIQYLVALWAGLDMDPEGYSGRQEYFFGQSQAAKAVRSFPLPPSIIVESGGGLHLYWLLKDVTPIGEVAAMEGLLGKINKYFQCETQVGIDSLMRLPETFNSKNPSAELKCSVKYINADFRYDLEEFEKLNLGSGSPAGKPGSFLDSVSEGPPDLPEPRRARVSGVANQSARANHEIHRQSDDSDAGEYEEAGTIIDSQEMSTLTVGTVTEESQTVVVLAEDSADLIADEIVDKVVEKLTDKLMEELVDQIVEKLVQRLTPNK